MAGNQQIAKTRVVIQAVLALQKRKVGRTKLAKLVYLADYRFYESTGRTITGNLYMWDHYGPNAVSHAVINEADKLASEGRIRMSLRPSEYGGSASEYWVDDPNASWQRSAALLDEGEQLVVMTVNKEFGRLTLPALVKRSKETKPFLKAKQYNILQMEQSPRAKELQDRLQSSGELLEEIELGLRDAEEGKWVLQQDIESFTKS